MSPSDVGDRFWKALAAREEALARGRGDTPTPDSRLTPEEQERLTEAIECLHLLHGKRPRGAAAAIDRGQFGRFQIVRELGRGGFGVVFLAVDPALGRQVALKVPRPEVLLTPEALRRFVREARAAAGLDHPNVVPVFEAGEQGPVAYLVSAYCEGPTLAAWLRQRDAPVPTRTAAALVAALADGAQHAHARGVLHRDVKPSNVLLEPRPAGELPFTPRLTDFGLAKLLDAGPEDPTRTGQLVGTPRYMAPEQAEPRGAAVGPATDVYALGVVLYELLLGRPPFLGETDVATARLVLDAEPMPPRRLRPDVPADLEAVCLKCLEKRAERRYVAAAALADDLRRFLAGQATAARPVGAIGRAGRWARRRPVVASLLAVCLAAIGVATWLGGRLSVEGQRARSAQQVAELQEFHAVLERVRQRRLERPEDWVDTNLADVARLAALPLAADYQAALRSEVAAALAAPRLRLVRELGKGKNAYVGAFSPDGGTLALGERYPIVKDELRVWLVRTTGEQVGELRYPVDRDWEQKRAKNRADGARSLAYSPDGRWLVLGTRGGRLVRWDLAQRRPLPVCQVAHTGDGTDHTGDAVAGLLFSRDGAVLLSGSTGNQICRWGVRDGWTGPSRHAGSLPRGTSQTGETTWINPARPDSGLRRFDIRTGGMEPQGVFSVDGQFTVSPDAARVAARTGDLGFNQWLLGPSRTARRPLFDPALGPLGGEEMDLAFTADGQWLLRSSQSRGRLELWDAVRGELVTTAKLRGGSAGLAISPAGRQVAVCEQERTLLFEIGASPVRSTLCEPGEVTRFAASADGDRLATATAAQFLVGAFRGPISFHRRGAAGRPWQREAEVLLADVGEGKHLALTPAARGYGLILAGQWAEQHVLATLDGRSVRVGRISDLQPGPDGQVWAAVEGGKLVRWSGQGEVETLHVVPAEEERAGGSLEILLRCADGVLAGRRDGKVMAFDTQGRLTDTWEVFVDQPVTALAISPDGAEALVGGGLGAVARLALPSGRVSRPATPPHWDAIVGLAFLADGVTLTASADQSIRLWDRSGAALLVLREAGTIAQATLSPGRGELWVLVKGEWGVRRWDLAGLRDRLADVGLDPGFTLATRRPAQPSTHGLAAEIFDQAEFRGLAERRRDRQVLFDGRTAAPGSIRWTGWLKPPRPGRWELRLTCDGDGTVWVDGREVLRHRKREGRSFPTTAVELPDRRVSFRLDYAADQPPARCSLQWRLADSSDPFIPVPPEAFYLDADRPTAGPPGQTPSATPPGPIVRKRVRGGDGALYLLHSDGVLARIRKGGRREEVRRGVIDFALGGDGAVYLLHSDGWVSVNDAPTWDGIRAMHLAGDGALHTLSGDGVLTRIPRGGRRQELAAGLAEFALGGDGTVYLLHNDGWVSVNGAITWGGVRAMHLAGGGALYLLHSDGVLARIRQGGRREEVRRGVIDFALGGDGAVYLLHSDGWVSANDAPTWGGIRAMHLAADGTLYLLRNDGVLGRVPRGGAWQQLDSEVLSFAMAPDGTVYTFDSSRQVNRYPGGLRSARTLLDSQVQAFAMAPDGTVYTFDSSRQVNRYPGGLRSARTILDRQVLSFAMAPDGTVYTFDSSRQVNRYPGGLRSARTLLDSQVQAFVVTPDWTMYTLSAGGVLARIPRYGRRVEVREGVIDFALGGDGTVYLLHSDGWVSVNDAPTWDGIRAMHLAGDGSLHLLRSDGVLARVPRGGSWMEARRGVVEVATWQDYLFALGADGSVLANRVRTHLGCPMGR